jgi:uncharacterized protein (DUF2235 family)
MTMLYEHKKLPRRWTVSIYPLLFPYSSQTIQVRSTMTQQMPKLASYKRIILCADGTWLASDQGDNSVPSNVAKIARAIATSGPDTDGKIVNQIVSYHSGLGSGDLPFQKAIYGKFCARIRQFALFFFFFFFFF